MDTGSLPPRNKQRRAAFLAPQWQLLERLGWLGFCPDLGGLSRALMRTGAFRLRLCVAPSLSLAQGLPSRGRQRISASAPVGV